MSLCDYVHVDSVPTDSQHPSASVTLVYRDTLTEGCCESVGTESWNDPRTVSVTLAYGNTLTESCCESAGTES